MSAFRARQRGSVRFDPYYKLSWWDERILAWREVQRQFPTRAAAVGTIPTIEGHMMSASHSERVWVTVPEGARWRTIEVTERGRTYEAV